MEQGDGQRLGAALPADAQRGGHLGRIGGPADRPVGGDTLVDLDDLDASISNGVLPESWQGKSVGQARQELLEIKLAENVKKADAAPAVGNLLDWRTWTLDKIQLQEKRGDIRRALREQAISFYCGMMGALILSRAIREADPGLSKAILAAERKSLLANAAGDE